MSDDPFTMDLMLCDEDGIVRSGAMHHGTDYPCTGHAHFAGEHIRCTGPAHEARVSFIAPSTKSHEAWRTAKWERCPRCACDNLSAGDYLRDGAE